MPIEVAEIHYRKYKIARKIIMSVLAVAVYLILLLIFTIFRYTDCEKSQEFFKRRYDECHDMFSIGKNKN